MNRIDVDITTSSSEQALTTFQIAFLVGLILLTVASIPAIIALQKRVRAKQTVEAEAYAARSGMQLDSAEEIPQPGFDLFGHGTDRIMTFSLSHQGSHERVFRYAFTTGGGTEQSRRHHTCAFVEIPIDAPHTIIGSIGMMSSTNRSAKLPTIAVGSPEFRKRFDVATADEVFADALLDAALTSWLLANDVGKGTTHFELLGPWMLCISKRLDFDDTASFLEQARELAANVPTTLIARYPIT